MRALGIIPARGRLKGVPRKNIRPLGGRPLLHYVLTAALRSMRLTRVVVSSEDEEILSVAADYGADVPLRRPGTLALDTTPDVPVLQHAVEVVEGTDGPFDVVVQLHATTHFCRPQTLTMPWMRWRPTRRPIRSCRSMPPVGSTRGNSSALKEIVCDPTWRATRKSQRHGGRMPSRCSSETAGCMRRVGRLSWNRAGSGARMYDRTPCPPSGHSRWTPCSIFI